MVGYGLAINFIGQSHKYNYNFCDFELLSN